MTPDAAPPRSADRETHAGRGRWIFFGIGWIFFALGMLGVALPLVPTTPFMILALWAFSRSSRRLHAWLYSHRLFGPPLQRWHRHRVITPWVKVVAIGFMSASMAYVALFLRPPWWTVAAMGAIIAFGIIFICRCPSRAPEQETPQ